MRERNIKVILIVVAVLYVILIVSRLNTFLFGSVTGFVYQASSDELFKVSLRTSVSNYSEILNPFESILYYRIDDVESLGKLDALVTNREQERKDPELARKRAESEFNRFMDETKRQLNEGFESIEITFYPRRDLNARDVIPAKLGYLDKYSEGNTPGLMCGDAVVVKWFENRPVQVVTMDKSILIRDPEASWKVMSLISE